MAAVDRREIHVARRGAGKFFSLEALLLLSLFAGCALGGAPLDVGNAVQPIRIIIRFQGAVPDSKPFGAAIARACLCQPIFLRPQGSDALIYEVVLVRGHGFAAFEQSLLEQAAQFGVRAVEEDRILRHQ